MLIRSLNAVVIESPAPKSSATESGELLEFESSLTSIFMERVNALLLGVKKAKKAVVSKRSAKSGSLRHSL